MKRLLDSVWQRRGVSWIWDDEALYTVARPSEVLSLRELLQAGKNWPDDLPSNDGNTLVVAGLDACIDLLSPTDAETWLGDDLKAAVLSFQDAYSGGRLIWGEARDYPQEIILADGAKPSGLFHLRIT